MKPGPRQHNTLKGSSNAAVVHGQPFEFAAPLQTEFAFNIPPPTKHEGKFSAQVNKLEAQRAIEDEADVWRTEAEIKRKLEHLIIPPLLRAFAKYEWLKRHEIGDATDMDIKNSSF